MGEAARFRLGGLAWCKPAQPARSSLSFAKAFPAKAFRRIIVPLP